MRHFTEEEIRKMVAMRDHRMSWNEIGRELERDPHCCREKYGRMKRKGVLPKPEERPALESFSPRELMKELYARGYRVEGKIYYVSKQYVNVESVISE